MSTTATHHNGPGCNSNRGVHSELSGTLTLKWDITKASVIRDGGSSHTHTHTHTPTHTHIYIYIYIYIYLP